MNFQQLRGRFLRGFAYRFIALCAPDLTEKVIKAATAAPAEPVA